MADIHRLPTTENFVDDRGVGFRATWHADDGVVALSVWHDEQCTASFRLPAGEAARLASHECERLGVASPGGPA